MGTLLRIPRSTGTQTTGSMLDRLEEVWNARHGTRYPVRAIDGSIRFTISVSRPAKWQGVVRGFGVILPGKRSTRKHLMLSRDSLANWLMQLEEDVQS